MQEPVKYYRTITFLILWTSFLEVGCFAILNMQERNVENLTYTRMSAVCQFLDDSYTCEDIPTIVPQNITKVVVTGFQDRSIFGRFTDSTWKQVKCLHLTADQVHFVFNNTFQVICHIEELMIHMKFVREFHILAFAGLDSLQKLDLLGMPFVSANTIIQSVCLPGMLPKLREMTFNPGTVDHPPMLSFSPNVVNALTKKPLKSFNGSNSLISGSYWSLLKMAMSNLEILNVSGATMIPTGAMIPLSESVTYTNKPLLQTFDYSRSILPLPPYLMSEDFQMNGKSKDGRYKHIVLSYYMLSIENIYADYTYKEDTIIVNSYNYSDAPFFWKTLSFRGNRLVTINCTWIFNKNNTLHFVDLSDNKIEYISPGFGSTFIHLKTLILSENRLYQMQHSKDFTNLLTTFRELVVLDFSQNSLSFIPFDMFEFQGNLETLNLGFNELTSVVFALSGLRSLKTLDLQNNKILSIEGADFSRLQLYIDDMMKKAKGLSLSILLDGNPLPCRCESLTFFQWLVQLAAIKHSDDQYYCMYDGETQLDKLAVEKCNALCKRILEIKISVPSSAVVVVLIILVIYLIHKRRKISAEERFRRDFNDQKLPEKYLMFVAFSSFDEDTVKPHLLVPLRDALKLRLKTNRDLISTGDDFYPGHPIPKESHSFISMSCVFIAVVSGRFCSSIFCNQEITQAREQQKPIILVFIENVDEALMRPELREDFKKRARVKLIVEDNGEVTLEPKLEKICDSIMSMTVQNKTKKAKFRTSFAAVFSVIKKLRKHESSENRGTNAALTTA